MCIFCVKLVSPGPQYKYPAVAASILPAFLPTSHNILQIDRHLAPVPAPARTPAVPTADSSPPIRLHPAAISRRSSLVTQLILSMNKYCK